MANLNELKADGLSSLIDDYSSKTVEELAEAVRYLSKELLAVKRNQVDELTVVMTKMSQQDGVISKCYRDIRELDAILVSINDACLELLETIEEGEKESPEDRFVRKVREDVEKDSGWVKRMTQKATERIKENPSFYGGKAPRVIDQMEASAEKARKAIDWVVDCLRHNGSLNPMGCNYDKLVDMASEVGIPEHQVACILMELKAKGDVYSPRNDIYKLINEVKKNG